MISAELAAGLRSGAVEAQEPPSLIKASLAFLEGLLGCTPQLGMTVAIGTLNPAVYRINDGYGQVVRREKSPGSIWEEPVMSHFFLSVAS